MKHKPIIDLLVLGSLLNKPMSATEIWRKIRDEPSTKSLTTSANSVHITCRKLVVPEYLVVKKAGKVPVYAATALGQRYFRTLSIRFAKDISLPALSANPVFFNLEGLGKKDSLKVWELMHQNIKALVDESVAKDRKLRGTSTFSQRAMYRQERMVAMALYEWSREYLVQYRSLAA